MASRRSNGEGSLCRRKDGRWMARIQVEGVRRCAYGATRREAAAKLDALRQQLVPSRPSLVPSSHTVDELLDCWLEAKAAALKPSTVHTYQETCRRHIRPELGPLALDRLTPQRLQGLYGNLQAVGHARTALKVHRLLSQSLYLAVRWDWLPANPCAKVDAPRYRPLQKELWTLQQLRTFLDGTRGHTLWPFWLLAAHTGCRSGELTALTWRDVDLPAASLSIRRTVRRIAGEWVFSEPKTRSGARHIGLSAQAVDALRQQEDAVARRKVECRVIWQKLDLVFPSIKGTPLEPAGLSEALRKACARLSLPPITTHTFRHLHASMLLGAGLPIPEVSRRLGHANPAITMAVYAHVRGHDDRAAVEAVERLLGAERVP
jgi:integrase